MGNNAFSKKCYEINGGTCQRLVAPPLFNCGVDHQQDTFALKTSSVYGNLADVDSMLWELQDSSCDSSVIRQIRNKHIDSWIVAKTIASHPDCPTDVLESVFAQWNNRSEDIELAIASNENATSYLLEQIFPPKTEEIACAIASHPASTDTLLQRVYDRYYRSKKVMDLISDNPSASDELLKRIWQEKDQNSKRAFASDKITVSITKPELESMIETSEETDSKFWVHMVQLACLKQADTSCALRAFNKYKFSSGHDAEVTNILKELLLTTYEEDPWVELAIQM